MKKLILIMILGFSNLSHASGKINFNSLINDGIQKQKSIDSNMKVLIEGVSHNKSEKEVLNFIANEVELEKASKLAEKNAKQGKNNL